MPRTFRPLLVLAAMALAGCGGSDNPYGFPSGPHAMIQVLHASADAPDLDVLIDGSVAIPDLDYGEDSGEYWIAAGAHTLAVQARTPGGPTTVIPATDLSFADDTIYTVVAEGGVANIGPVVFSHVASNLAAGATRVQIVHAVPSAAAVAVYVTAPGADLASSAPLGTVAYQGSLGPIDMPSGSYEIRITPATGVTPVLFDSGTVTLTAGADLLLAATANTGPGAAPIVLAASDVYGNSAWLYDVATPSTLRVVHDSPDAPALGVTATSGGTATVLTPSVAYPNFVPYQTIASGAYALQITPAGNAASVLVNQNQTLYQGHEYTVYAMGALANIGALVTRDYRRRLATEAKLRIIDGAPSIVSADIYLTAPGAGVAASSPVYTGVPFAGDTGFQGYTAGSYDLTITASGSKTALIGPVTVNLADSGIYTVVARDAPGGGAPQGLILLDDFAP